MTTNEIKISDEIDVDENYHGFVLEELKNDDLAKIYLKQIIEEEPDNLESAIQLLVKAGQKKIVIEMISKHLENYLKHLIELMKGIRKAPRPNPIRYAHFYSSVMKLKYTLQDDEKFIKSH